MELPSDVAIQIDGNVRLALRKSEHESLIYPAIDANRDFLAQWVWWADKSYSKADLVERNRQFEREYELGKACLLDIFVKDEFAGTVDIHNIESSDSAEVGYWLIEKFTSRGVASQAVSGLIKYAREVYDIHYFYIETDEKNLASTALAERLGFTRENMFEDGSGNRTVRYGLRPEED